MFLRKETWGEKYWSCWLRNTAYHTEISVGQTHTGRWKMSSSSHICCEFVCTESFACMEVVVSLGSPSCLWAPSPIQLLHAVSHRRIPSEDRECSFRLLLVPRNMKRPMQRAGLTANEQTVGGWLLPHTSAAGGLRGKETQRQGTMNSNKDFPLLSLL